MTTQMRAFAGGFPRSRGDRPRTADGAATSSTVPPLTRGSTPAHRLPGRPDAGSPAHAGIDPAPARPKGAGSGFPRSRGDRPAIRRCFPTRGRVPPLTRGSTVMQRVLQHRLTGSPAHAGIDPRARPRRAGGRRFPRSRGDRPPKLRTEGEAPVVPPLTRGSTAPRDGRSPVQRGSPAHAGIDPRRRPVTDTTMRFPRSRGDRPSAITRSSRQRRVPPLTRGSTFASGDERRCHRGSPAHAGIDPRRRHRPT